MSTRVDVHAHISNLAYLPIEGILVSRGIPAAFAGPVAALLDGMCSVDEGEQHRLLLRKLERVGSMEDVPDGMLATVVAASVPDHVLAARRGALAEASIYLDSVAFPPVTDADAVDVLSRAVELHMSLQRVQLRRILRALEEWIEGGRAFVAWLLAMCVPESELASRLRSTWPGIDLFIFHMMDMDNHHPAAPGRSAHSRFAFVDEQIPRMRRLAERSGGRLLGFVAYDPFRPYAVQIVRHALEHGFAGVKLYPPSGYRPIGNRDGELRGATAAEVDRRNLELFRLCCDMDVPIFAHCSPGGMERVRGVTGAYSDPSHWRRVLQHPDLRHLRLCLGHAGGEDAWNAYHDGGDDGRFERSFAGEVVRLCVEFPNVYCELGHFDQIVDGVGLDDFRRRLVRLVRTHGAHFAGKIMYGSDWHLLVRQPRHARYLAAFEELFERTPELQPYAEGFFGRNALAFLNLPAFLARNEWALRPHERDHFAQLAGAVMA